MLSEIIPIVPVLMVALSACAVMLAEAFRRPGDWMPVGWFGILGCLGGAYTSIALWDQHAVGFGVVTLDNFAIFFNVTLCAIGVLTIRVSSGTAERDHLPTGE